MTTFLFISFIAGALTVLAPCILPLLPVVIGSAAAGRSRATPYVVVASLGLSVIAFTFLLKVSSVFIMVPPEVWTYISGGVLALFGATLLLPSLWEHIPGMARLSRDSNKLLGTGYQKKSLWGDVVIGAALGPIFSSCSPTYFVILASVLPASFLLGTLYLVSYTAGLSVVLLAIAVLGERLTNRLAGLSDPHGWFKRLLGVLFIILGVMIAFGVEKVIEAKILSSGFFDITRVEQYLLQTTEMPTTPPPTATSTVPVSAPRQSVSKAALPISPIVDELAWVPANAPLYHEIVAPAGFVNTNDEPIRIADYVGKKVILLDVMTYSCINCQRTFPYVVSWYGKYKDQGLIVIGIHTPEFAFEKDKHNVEEAMKRFGITFPIVLDNDYGTWNAYGNRFWPRKYLIDIHGKVVFDHIGEGGYEEMEMKIRDLLAERASVLGEQQSSNQGTLSASSIVAPTVAAGSPETYFGAGRNQYLENGVPGQMGQQNVVLPQEFALNKLYLGGSWMFADESAQASAGAKVIYRYNAKQVYLVASALADTVVEVWQDGQRLTPTVAGGDVKDGSVTVRESRLYSLVNNQVAGEHVLELRFPSAGASLYTFTFG